LREQVSGGTSEGEAVAERSSGPSSRDLVHSVIVAAMEHAGHTFGLF